MTRQSQDLDINQSKAKDLISQLSNASYEGLQALYTKILSFDSTVSSEISRRKSLLARFEIIVIHKESGEIDEELTRRFSNSDMRKILLTFTNLIYYGVLWVEVVFNSEKDEFLNQLITPDSISFEPDTGIFKITDIDGNELILNNNPNMIFLKYGSNRINESGLAYVVASKSIEKYFLSRSFLEYTDWQNKPIFLIADRGNCSELIDDQEKYLECKENFRQTAIRGMKSNVIVYDDPVSDSGEEIFSKSPVSVIEPSSAMDSLVSQLNNIEKQIISAISGNDSIGQTTNLAGSRASLEVFERSLNHMVENDKLFIIDGLKRVLEIYGEEKGIDVSMLDIDLISESGEETKE
jgi:hypothetical protein